MTTETPRDETGDPLCAWCGGPVQQSGIGRRREYCSRTHREYAYRARREQEMKLRAYSAGRADERRLSSTDGTPAGSVSTVDETVSVPAPLPGVQRPADPPAPTRRVRRVGSPIALWALEDDEG